MQIKNDRDALRDALNIEAFNDPRPGDYWSEHFCPYFIIVDIKGDDIYVLSALGGVNSYNRKHEIYARKSVGSAHWTFDTRKAMIVDKAWIEKAVKYGSIEGFVAEVSRRIDLITGWQKDFAENPYEVPREIDLIPKPTPEKPLSKMEVIAKLEGFPFNDKTKSLMIAVIEECAVIATDANRLRLPASQYADLITKFEDVLEE
jgi:hypothetical protein